VLQSYDNRSTGRSASPATPALDQPPFPAQIRTVCPSSIRRVMWLPAIHVPANPRNLSYRNLPVPKLQHQDVTMNGNVRYTRANTSLANYYDDFQGLAGTTREATYAGNASAKREAIASDYASLGGAEKAQYLRADRYSNVHQPGVANMTSLTTVTAATRTSIARR